MRPARRSPVFLFLWGLSRATLVLWFRYRIRGGERSPRTGATIYVANHVSHLDPVLVGASTCRPMRYMARSTLFRARAFGAVIRFLGAIPLEREGVGVGGYRAVLSALAAGDAVVVFPEGTRSRDGELGHFRPGAARIAQRSGAQVVPVWVEGSRRAFPPGARFPRPCRVEVRVGEAYRVDPGLAPETAALEMKERLRALARRPLV